MRNPVLVLGIGNTLFTDDGAGLYAVRLAASRWQGRGVDFAEAMVGGLELMDLLAGYQAALIVDAAVTGCAAPGEVFLIDVDSLPAFAGGGAHGAHLGTALETAARLGVAMPSRVVALAIEAGDVETLGEELTPPVAAAMETACTAILSLATELVSGV